MLAVNIITIGKLKESYLREACDEYIKRLGAFCNVRVIELPECRIDDNPSVNQITSALATEAKGILAQMEGRRCYHVALCVEGKQLSSTEVSRCIDQAVVRGNSTINFIVGSSYGLGDAVKDKSTLRLSMSKMTFPHQLARVMLLEQVYRAFQISSNGRYHK